MRKVMLALLVCSMMTGCVVSGGTEVTEPQTTENVKTETAEIVKKETETVMATEEETQSQAVNGWIEQAEGFQYLENGSPAIGWREIDGEAYYFNQSGWMQTGEKKLGNQGFTFDENGHLRGIYGLENNGEEIVYYYEDGKYVMNDGYLYWEDAAGSRSQVFDWMSYGMSGFIDLGGNKHCGIMDFTVADGKIYAATTEGLAYMQLDGTECRRIAIEGSFAEPCRTVYGLAAGHGRMYYCIGIEEASDLYYPPQSGVMTDGSYMGWEGRNPYRKMQAAGERNGFLAVKTVTESDVIFAEGLDICDRQLVWVTEAGEQTLIDGGVDEYLFCGNTVWYMKGGQLQKMSVGELLI